MDHQRSVRTPVKEYAADRFMRIASKTPAVYDKVLNACKDLIVSIDTLHRVMREMEKSMKKGLAGERTSLMMLPSFVRAVPDGTEKGSFLALDLGGTNFRVLLIKINGRKQDMRYKIYSVPQDVMLGTATKLFDHIATCLADFVASHGLTRADKLPLGFTFSFPCAQEGLSVAKLIRWTKGFKAEDAVGKDVAALLRDAIHRQGGIQVEVTAVLNDTVGTLLSCAFKDNLCQVGIILGTGTNACYMEQLSNCQKLKSLGLDKDPYPKQMIINMEWGAFGECGELEYLRTPYDHDVDKNSINPKEHLFEKMISGMFMGELVRLVLLHLAKEGVIFDGQTDTIAKKDSFLSKYVSEIESGQVADLPHHRTIQTLLEAGISHVTELDCCVVAYVCTVVSTRAASLCAAGIATVLKHMNKASVTVGIDGSVYKFHPNFSRRLNNILDVLVPPELDYQLMLSSDGSGCGAAIVAAVATRMEEQYTDKTPATSSDTSSNK